MRKKLSAPIRNGVSSLKSNVRETTNTVRGWFDGKATLTALFAGSIVSANVLASKIAAFDIPGYGVAVAPAGFIALGAAFLFSDTLSELYGPETAHKAVNGTIAAVIASLGLIHVSIAMPSAPFYELGAEYKTILSAGTSISLASVATMAVSQNLDVTIFHKLRERGLPKWVRNIGSTATSQLVDTALFIVLAFAVFPQIFDGTVTPLAALLPLIASQYVLKLIVAVGETPLFYAMTAR